MKRPLRLWGKKRGERMSGWWLIGRVSEVAYFGALTLLGVAALTLVIGWQLVSPETNVFSIGYGFWLLILVSVSFIGIGGLGFVYHLMTVAISDEHRAALVRGNFANGPQTSAQAKRKFRYLPALTRYTDSPGVHLRYRLPELYPQTNRILFTGLLVMIWDAFVMVLATLVVAKFLLGNPGWFAIVIIIGFIYVAVQLTRRFMVELFYATRIGSTVVEIAQLPLRAGESVRMQVVQHGRMSIKKLEVALVCEERATYHFGTDVRTEAQEIQRIPLLNQGRVRIEDGDPLQLNCDLQVPVGAMHSFVSPHNAIAWKVVVEGDVSRWPSFCRNFPVVVYPRELEIEKEVALS